MIRNYQRSREYSLNHAELRLRKVIDSNPKGIEMGKLSRGWALTKLSFNVIGKDKEILLFPVISGIALIMMAASFFGVYFFAFGLENIDAYSFVAFFLVFYFLSSFVIVFFNVALVSCAMPRLNGGVPDVLVWYQDGSRPSEVYHRMGVAFGDGRSHFAGHQLEVGDDWKDRRRPDRFCLVSGHLFRCADHRLRTGRSVQGDQA